MGAIKNNLLAMITQLTSDKTMKFSSMLKHGFTMGSEDMIKTYFVLHKTARF